MRQRVAIEEITWLSMVHGQIIHYARGNFKKSKSIMTDLKLIVGKHQDYCGKQESKRLQLFHVYKTMIEVLAIVAEPYQDLFPCFMRSWLFQNGECWRPDYSEFENMCVNMEDVIVQILKFIKKYERFSNELVLEPDESLLPLSRKYLSRHKK